MENDDTSLPAVFRDCGKAHGSRFGTETISNIFHLACVGTHVFTVVHPATLSHSLVDIDDTLTCFLSKLPAVRVKARTVSSFRFDSRRLYLLMSGFDTLINSCFSFRPVVAKKSRSPSKTYTVF
ncbi:hypothetical protein AVEN_258500-1 [Araneus ventricosus]|uniref:Uncharacterized protein n=1 Tax=Araneus ventricosus TaxID=182803 RepID=A0A4Y2H899_ARAVE|nr:hypothetical protein AVEN_258500-1 [Araneus ventricosus]